MKWIRYFILSAGVILLIAALDRFLIAISNAQVLSLPEPLLGIPFRIAVLLVGGVELTVALLCLFGNRLGLQVGWLAWLGTNYIVIWIGLFTMNVHPQATGIGSLTDPLHLTRGIVGAVVVFIPVYLLVGSYAGLIWGWWAGRRTKPANHNKMSCPSCGGHIKFAIANLGQQIPCPHCQTAVTLRKPDENLKLSCFFCQGHIAFPAHSLGTKMACPHCNRDITLLEPKVSKPAPQ